MSQQLVTELLLTWGLARERGQEPSSEELCREHPELLPLVRSRLEQLKRMSWLEEREEHDGVDDELSLPAWSSVMGNDAGRARSHTEVALAQVSLSIEELQQILTETGLMSLFELQSCVAADESQPTDSASMLAGNLVRTGLLTQFQVRMVAEGKGKELVLGNYVLLDRLGAGGMGQVFKARHRRMKRLVALKVLPNNLVKSQQAIDRFHREVEAAAKLDHPNIVTAHDADEANGRHFLAMQYVEGQDLLSLVRGRGPLSPGQAIGLLLQAARGLEYAHKRGIVHRDIKPSNLLLDAEGMLKILDMGLARITRDQMAAATPQQAELTQQGVVMGTVDYMSPEQALDTHSADERSDIYSLGCTLYFLLTGDAVFPGQTLMAKMLAHREGAIPSLVDRCPGVPACLDSIFQKMLAKRPEDRFASMTALLGELDACANLAETLAPAPGTAESTATDPVEAKDKGLRDTSSAAIDATIEHRREVEHEPLPPRATSAALGTVASRRLVLIALGMLIVAPLLWYAAQLVFRVPTPDGELVVEVDDPNVLIVVHLNGIEVHDKTNKREFKLKQGGIGEVKVLDRESGLELTTKEFALRQGGKVRVIARHEVAVARAQLAKVQKAPAASLKDPDRAVAEWVLSVGGWVRLTHGDKYRRFTRLEELPQGPIKLWEIHLQNCQGVQDADLVRIQGLGNLSTLDLGQTGITVNGLAHLERLPNLKDLRLTALQLGGLRKLHDLPALESIGLGHSNITDEGLAVFGAMGNLTSLDVSWTKVGNAGLKHLRGLSRLTFLGLEATRVTDEGLPEVLSLRELQHLTLPHGVTPKGFAALKLLPNLTVLAVGGLASDTDRAGLAELPQLRKLTLRQAQGNLKDWRFLEALKQLDSLWIGHCALLDDAVAQFALAPGLRKLTLYSVPITDAGAVHLHKLQQLTELSVVQTKISASGVKALHDALPRCAISSDHGTFAPKIGGDRNRAAD